MCAHRASYSRATGVWRNHERSVSDMRSQGGLIRPEKVSANDLSIFCGDVGPRVRSDPIRHRIFARDMRIESIGVTARNHGMKNIPDRIAICFCGRPDLKHSLNKRLRKKTALGIYLFFEMSFHEDF